MQNEIAQVRDLSAFDRSVSLYQLLPCGDGKALRILKTIVDACHEQPGRRVPSLLIVGNQGKSSYGRAFQRALGIEQIHETDARLLTAGVECSHFFSPKENEAHIITSVEKLPVRAESYLYSILRNQTWSLKGWDRKVETFPVLGSIVMTTGSLNAVSEPIRDAVDHIVQLSIYSEEQLRLIVLQRIRYCGLGYQEEEVLGEIVRQGHGTLRHIIRFLRVCIAVALSSDRSSIGLHEVHVAQRIV
jgi:Holliday junction resolvasome RuvABC ATP-dependent DNA helicase subunit